MLDVRTLIFAVVAANVICFVALSALCLSRVPVKGPLSWAAAKLFTSLGLALLFLRGIIPDFMSIVLGNGLLVLGPILEWHGIRRFLGCDRCSLAARVIMLGSAPLLMALLFYFSAVEPMIWLRRFFVSFLFSSIGLLAARDLLSHTPKTSAIKFAAFLYLAHSLLMLTNLTLSLSGTPGIEQHFLAPGIYNSLLFIYAMLTAVLVTFAMMLMVGQELQNRLEKQATQDPLTGLYNRLALDMFGGHAFAHMQRSDKPLAALMIDLDHFKKINDAKGHAAGDKMLCHFSDLLKAVTRSEDLLFRYGGEEFVVLVPVANREGCIALAERIRIACQSQPCESGKECLYFSVSIGLAMAQLDDKCVYDSINRADEALYRAKNSGRNKVVVRDPECKDGFFCPPPPYLPA